MAQFKVVVTARSFGKSDSRASNMLEDFGCRIVKIKTEDPDFDSKCMVELADADAVIAGLEPFGEDKIKAAAKLKIISRYGVGCDNVDKQTAAAQGIQVTNTPGSNSESVADLAVGLMLCAARSISYMDAAMKAHNQKRPQGLEMYGKTLGVVGAGSIGRGVAKRCRGFCMKVLCYDLYENESFKKECDAEYVSFERLVRESDFITIHSPLTPETQNMFGTKEFKMMKKDTVIVNTARGGIIDEAALCEALKSGEIRAAGLDATVNEPPYGDEILTLDNCVVTPHAGAATIEASSNMSYLAAQNIVDVLSGKICSNKIN